MYFQNISILPLNKRLEIQEEGVSETKKLKKYMKLTYCNFQRGRKGGGGVLEKNFSMGLVGRYTILKYDNNHHSMIQSRWN